MHTSKFYTIPLGLCLRVSDVVPNPLTILLINVYVTYYICMGAAESFHLYSSLTDDASDAISEDRILQVRQEKGGVACQIPRTHKDRSNLIVMVQSFDTLILFDDSVLTANGACFLGVLI